MIIHGNVLHKTSNHICSVITQRHQDRREKIEIPLTCCHFNSLQDVLTPEINFRLQEQCTIFIFMINFYHQLNMRSQKLLNELPLKLKNTATINRPRCRLGKQVWPREALHIPDRFYIQPPTRCCTIFVNKNDQLILCVRCTQQLYSTSH